MLVHWVGHSTVLAQIDGLNLLMDPIWSQRCSPIAWIGPARIAEPGIPFEALPPIDLVLVSHNHYDHCDLPTIRRLVDEHDPQIIVPSGMGKLLKPNGTKKVLELLWWESHQFKNLTITGVPAAHWSGRHPADSARSLWCGWVVSTGGNGDFYFAGDTAWWPTGFEAIGHHFTEIRTAAIPIGAYEPRALMEASHVNPEEAELILQAVGAKAAIAIHHSTFRLSNELRPAPAERLREVCSPHFVVLDHGGVHVG